MCYFLSYLLSALLGGIVSFAIWLITSRCEWFLPQIDISPNIVKRPDSLFYEIKIINRSHRREIHDVAIYAMYKYVSGNHYERKLGHIALLKKLPKHINNRDDELFPFELKLLIAPPQIKQSQPEITLKDFFSKEGNNGTKGYLDVVVVCYDSFVSSARRVKSVRYTMDSIMDNAFFELGSITPKKLSDNGYLNAQ